MIRKGRVSGKVAIVTGGASGIGAASCRLLAAEGARVTIADIDEAQGLTLADELGDAGVFRKLDVSMEEEWRGVVDYTEQRWGGLHVLVNNAGVSGSGGRARTEETTLKDWERVMSVNSTGVFLGVRASIPAMRRARGGSIVNVSSIYGIAGSKAGSAYHASKGAVRTFTKAAAVQYASDNIRVNSVHPGFTDTPMTSDIHADPNIRTERLSMTPMGRLGIPEDIAYGILYLASDEASWVTGIELIIDGGVLAH